MASSSSPDRQPPHSSRPCTSTAGIQFCLYPRIAIYKSVAGICCMYACSIMPTIYTSLYCVTISLCVCVPVCRAFDVEVLYIAQQLGMPVDEVAVNWKEIEGECVAGVYW